MNHRNIQSVLLSATSAMALAAVVQISVPDAAFAQAAGAAPAPADAPVAEALEEIVVTGSRIKTGFTTPTPVTITTAEDLLRTAPNNIVDAINQLPSFAPSARTEVPSTAATGGLNGQNLLNLRNLGANRNLILLDGRRLPATNSGGSVDSNVIPQSLVKRVDVVTGGASAAYGSDAVSGVVNYVLDTSFKGLKADLGAGISTYGDLPGLHGSLAVGQSFANGRVRIIGSIEAFGENGIDANKDSHRKWFEKAAGQIPNPVAGASPSILVIPDIRSALGTYGGLVTNTVLKGTQFLPGGGTSTFNPGTITGSSFQSGGDGARANIAFAPDQRRANAFVHGEFDVSNRLTVFAEAHNAYTNVESGNQVNPHTGAANQFTIFSGNAYLPAAIQARMTASGLASFTMGRYEGDFPLVDIDAVTRLQRYAIGAKGKLGGNWTFDLSYTYGRTHQEVAERNLTINHNLYAAADAVVSPTGQVVCRSALSGVDPTCVPLNLFGVGAPSAAAIRYVTGDSIQYLTLKQNVAQLNLAGDLGNKINLGAGPISVAAGLEYRKESANQTVDPLSPLTTDFTGVRGFPTSQQGRPGAFNFFNPLPLAGSYDIQEGYAEVGVPVFRDRVFAKSLDLDGAVRHAKYSLSGDVTTWKYGANYAITDEFRLRYSKSRDIRAPNILELFNSATQNSNNQVFNGKSTATLQISSGNPALKPERALTSTFGAVYRPNWLSGLQTSLDYYTITISDAIGTLTAQNTIDQCAAGSTFACSNVIVSPSGTLTVFTRQLNLSVAKASGYDFETVYSRNAWGGNLRLRLLVNHITDQYTQAPGATTLQVVGTAPSPRWRGNFQTSFSTGRWNFMVQERYIGSVLMNANIIQKTSDTNKNNVPAIWYTDLNVSYKMNALGRDEELYFSVSNILNRNPPVNTINPTSFSQPTNAVYDRDGRYFSGGIRVRF